MFPAGLEIVTSLSLGRFFFRKGATDAQLVGMAPLVVGVRFMSPSVLAVILGCLGLAESVGGVGGLAVGPSGAFMPSGGALMLLTPLGTLVAASRVIAHVGLLRTFVLLLDVDAPKHHRRPAGIP